MKTLRSLLTIAIVTFASSIFAQNESLLFSLQQLPDLSWGVFVKPIETIIPSDRTAAGSGQVTIVAPADFSYTAFTNVGGTWVENARVNSPEEATDKAYISFGFVNDNPRIELYPNEETLLFTFMCSNDFAAEMSLFENNTDPFATPNSKGTNPGNDIGMLDFGTGNGMQTYRYAGNYNNQKAQGLAVHMIDDDENDDDDDE